MLGAVVLRARVALSGLVYNLLQSELLLACRAEPEVRMGQARRGWAAASPCACSELDVAHGLTVQSLDR
ncbi:hypothetical protein H920_01877 [Fukomys damarensis]|uniref:Uncharacterized protein n=1 Tax=Fukomys damarensis TaxID=885580 RepID=A0A091EM24_FUKDA|nr:hypothetical protein H920_01877 [Fukomys damarensis]